VINDSKNINMVKEISLIIPSHNDKKKLLQLLNSISNWEIMPNEILIIDSSIKEPSLSSDLLKYFNNNNIKVLIIHKKNMYPGHARNIGINKSTNSMIAFLDAYTHPSNKWMLDGINHINANNSDGVWGRTYYEANTFTAKIIRACTFGRKPIKTFPGSILKKDIFNKCGLFIETTRAGEDGDWMYRAELQKINMCFSQQFLSYDKLNRINIFQLLKKWFRNYSHSSKLPHRQRHKNYYYYGISIFAVLFAYNWNRILAAWDTTSIFYIPNITKISFFSIIMIYFYIRGLYLPRKKGESFMFIFPINFMFIIFLSALLDITKTFAFIKSKFDRQ